MPLRETKSGYECPLGNFLVSNQESRICDGNSVEDICKDCYFSDLRRLNDFSPNQACDCPEDLTHDKYDILFRRYNISARKKGIEPSPKGLLCFINNYLENILLCTGIH